MRGVKVRVRTELALGVAPDAQYLDSLRTISTYSTPGRSRRNAGAPMPETVPLRN